MSKKKEENPQPTPQIATEQAIPVYPEGEALDAVMLTYKTRAAKRKTYRTKSGIRTYYQGLAQATIALKKRWVTANADTEREATVMAILRAQELEKAEKEALDRREKEMVLAALTNAANVHNLPSLSNGKAMTFGALIDEYIDYCRDRGREDSTLSQYQHYRGIFCALRLAEGMPPLGEMHLADLAGKRKLVQIVHDQMERELSANTVRNRFGFLKSALNYAKAEGHWQGEKSPLDNVEIAARNDAGDIDISEADLSVLARSLWDDAPMLAALMVAVGCGSRAQETVGLTEDSIEGGRLVFRRQLKRVDVDGKHGPGSLPVPEGAAYGRTPKGQILALGRLKSARKVVEYELDPRLKEVLEEALDTAKPVIIWDAVEKRWRTVRFIVHAPGGGAQEAQHLRAQFTTICKKHGVKAKLHNLRAVFACNLMASGCDIKTVSRVMRHCDVKTTEGYLSNLRGESVKATMTASTIAASLGSLSMRRQLAEPTSPNFEGDAAPLLFERSA